MIDKKGNKYLYLDCDKNYPDWSIDGTLSYDEPLRTTFWLREKDYTVWNYQEILSKYFHNAEGLVRKSRIRELGFSEIIAKSYMWSIDLILEMINSSELTNFFHDLPEYADGNALEHYYDFFQHEVGLVGYVEVIEEWWKCEMAVQWCKENNVPYVFHIEPEDIYAREDPRIEFRAEIIGMLNECKFSNPMFKPLRKIVFS